MKRIPIFAVALAVFVPLAAGGQDVSTQLGPFTRTLGSDGLTLNLVHLNSRTVPILFQAPTLYAIRARAAETTMLYVQGVAERNVRLDTTNFTIEQGGQSIGATPMNIKHFERGTVSVPSGDRVDGVLAFERAIDPSKPFVVKHGNDSVEFSLDANALRQIAEATPTP
jgi:hypothetical protein